MLTMLVAMAGIAACTSRDAPARSAPRNNAIPGATRCKNKNPALLDSAYDNRYLLLLLFEKSADADVSTAFGFQDWSNVKEKRGCLADPDGIADTSGNTHDIYVQGGCPTDCVRGMIFDTVRTESDGNPLSREPSVDGTNKPPVWGIYFADEGGALEKGDKDAPYSSFHVWQILARDSCHAGTILASLLTSKDAMIQKLFAQHGPYLGHIMVAYTQPTNSPKSPKGHTISCAES